MLIVPRNVMSHHPAYPRTDAPGCHEELSLQHTIGDVCIDLLNKGIIKANAFTG